MKLIAALHRQRGVAIITALLIVALAATISAGIATSLQLEVRRTGNLLNNDQALLYVKPAEKLARNVLEEDRKNNSFDDYSEGWAQDIPPIDMDGVLIVGRITDMQACFNLNSLSASIATTAKDRFKRLLGNYKISATVTDAVIDWVDDDNDTTIPDGAEDGYYMNLERPYRTANQPFQSISSLRLVRGFEDSKKLAPLLPALCAFGASANINVNTAPAEVLLSLAASMTASDVDSIIQERKINPFDSMARFLNYSAVKTKITDATGLSVDSEYFLLTTYLQAGSVKKTVYSIINRTPAANTSVIRRSQNVL
jgi:general secretion pathway protein K